MTNIRLRPAIAMVELIFALVIMAIALMSAPMLISVSTKSVQVGLQQESLNEASSRVNMLLTYPWDQNDTNDSCIPPVLTVTNGDIELDINITTARRIGVPATTNSRTFKCGDNILTASLAVDGKDDIDDFIGTTTLSAPGGGAGGVDYIEQNTVQMTTNVVYGRDAANYNAQSITFVPGIGVASSNIKNITVTLTSTSTEDELKNKQITFQAFSCNIGGIEYRRREL